MTFVLRSVRCHASDEETVGSQFLKSSKCAVSYVMKLCLFWQHTAP
jgi:hypothetical protein